MSSPNDIIRDSLPERAPLFTGQDVIGTSAVQLASADPELFTGVILKADVANAGIIYVGFSDGVLTTTGYPLNAGDELPIPVRRIKKIWLIASAVSQDIAWFAA